jgi:hypothetical protein
MYVWLAFFFTGPSPMPSSTQVSTTSRPRGLFSDLGYTVEKLCFTEQAGEVGGLLFKELRVGEDMKKLGGLEVGTGEDSKGTPWTEKSSEKSTEQPSTQPGELGGRGDTGRAKATETGSVETGRASCSFERSARESEKSFPGDGAR